jgi:hypothetical protein
MDLDLQDADNFIQNDEMVGYVNEGIKEAESDILKLSEDYFLVPDATITWVSGTADYALPSDIYGEKIRGLVYVNGVKIYPIRRLRDPDLFYKIQELNINPTNEQERQFFLKSGAAGAQGKFTFVPTPQESGAFVKYAYIRSAQRVPLLSEGGTRTAQLATILDIPEWTDFIIQWAKVRCYEKEKDSRLPDAQAALLAIRKSMNEALTQKTPDNEDQIPMDMGFYCEHN